MIRRRDASQIRTVVTRRASVIRQVETPQEEELRSASSPWKMLSSEKPHRFD